MRIFITGRFLYLKWVLVGAIFATVFATAGAEASNPHSRQLCSSLFQAKDSVHYGIFREDLSSTDISVWRLVSGAILFF